MSLLQSTLAIRWRRGRLIARILISLVLSIGPFAALSMPNFGSRALLAPLAGLVFFVFAIKAARQLIASGKPALCLDRNGFEGPFLTEGPISWQDVDDVSFAKRRRTLYLDLTINDHAAGRIKKNMFQVVGLANANLVVLDLSLLNIQPEQLALIFRDGARAARGQYFTSALSPEASTPANRAAKAPTNQPVFAYGLIMLLTGILLIETLLRLRAGPDPLSIDTLTLYGLGATQRIAVVDRGEVWRLVTATLLHGGWLHLAGNAVALWFAARLIEHLVGWRWFAAIFAISALAGAIVSVAVNPPLIVGVGASGGIVGLAAATAVLAFRFPAEVRVAMLVGGLRIVIPAMAPFLTNARGAGQTVIDVAAHGGGAVAGGIVAAFLLNAWDPRASEPPFRRVALVMTLAFFGTALVSLYPIAGSYEDAKGAAALDRSFPVDFKDAIAQAPALIEVYPRDPRVRAAYAETFVAKRDIEKAKAELREALADKLMLQPGLTTSLEPFLRVRLAQLLFDQNDKTEAAAVVAPICSMATGRLKPALARMALCR